jgi:hypothetical protein
VRAGVPNEADAPTTCPVCGRVYDSVSDHDGGLLINLLDNDRYRRVCAEPVDGPRVRFFHHTHEQAAVGAERGEDPGPGNKERDGD